MEFVGFLCALVAALTGLSSGSSARADNGYRTEAVVFADMIEQAVAQVDVTPAYPVATMPALSQQAGCNVASLSSGAKALVWQIRPRRE